MSTLPNSLTRNASRWTMLIAAAALVIRAALPAAAMPSGHGSAQGSFGMPVMGDPGHVDRLLDSVNASAEQRAQV